MRILVDIEQKVLKNKILNILQKERDFMPLIYEQVKRHGEDPEIIITSKGFFESELSDPGSNTKEFNKQAIIVLICFEQQYKTLFDWLSHGISASMLDTEVDISLFPILRNLAQAMPGPTIISAQLLMLLCGRYLNRQVITGIVLSPREKDVLSAIIRGASYKMAGHELGISSETVRGHVKNIYKKLNAGSLAEAVAKAIRYDLVDYLLF